MTLGEFFLHPSVTAAATGVIEFDLHNEGTVPHELIVVRTDLSPDKLPVSGGAVDEKAVDVVGFIYNVQAGATRALSLTLPAGHYVLICNLRGHYQSGMYAGLTVQ